MEKEFEKHFSFRLNKFLNFSDICFSHHSALHTDPDKINTFHLVGETGPSGNRGLGRGKYFNIILCKHSFSSHSLKSPLVMSSAAGLRGQRVGQITQLTHFSPPSSSAPSTGWALCCCVFSSHVFLAILKCFSSPHQARPVDSSQHFSVRLLLFVRVSENILHSNIDKYQFQYILHILISQNKQQTDWIYVLLSSLTQDEKYIFSCLCLVMRVELMSVSLVTRDYCSDEMTVETN